LSYYQKGEALFERESYLDAINEFKTADKFKPDCHQCKEKIKICKEKYIESHYNNGIRYLESKQCDKAMSEFNNVFANDSDYRDIKQKLEEAKRCKNFVVVINEGNSFLKEGHFDNAIVKFNEVIEIDSDNEKAKIGLFRTYLAKGEAILGYNRFTDAKSAFETAFKYASDLQCQECLQKYQATINYCQKKENEFKNKHYRLGVAKLENKHCDEALEVFNKVIAIDRNYHNTSQKIEEAKRCKQINILFEAADKLLKLGQIDQAISKLNQILTLDPDNRIAKNKIAQISFDKGIVLLQNNQYQKAHKAFEYAHRHNNQLEECLAYIKFCEIKDNIKRGIEFYQNNKYDTAIIVFEKAYKAVAQLTESKQITELLQKEDVSRIINKKLHDSHYNKATNLCQNGDYPKAKNEYEAAYKYKTDCKQCQQQIDNCKKKYINFHFSEAKKLINNSENDKFDVALRNYKEALEHIDRVIKVDPDNNEIIDLFNRTKKTYEYFKNEGKSNS